LDVVFVMVVNLELFLTIDPFGSDLVDMLFSFEFLVEIIVHGL